MTLTIACAGLGLVVLTTLIFSTLPQEYRVWNLSVIGALALFTAARLGLLYGLVFTAAAIALKDLCLYFTSPWWEPYPLSWVYFSGYALVGWLFLRRSVSIGRPIFAAFSTGVVFFLISNFVSWTERALPYYDHSLTGLMNCYIAGIPFYRGTFIGDVPFTTAFFGVHTALCRAFYPAELAAITVGDEAKS